MNRDWPSTRITAVHVGPGSGTEEPGTGHARRERASDAIGRISRTEFAVIALGTGEQGALKLTERLAHAVEEAWPASGGPPAPRVRAGHDVVADYHATPVDPVDLLEHATSAFRMCRAAGGRDSIRKYEPAQHAG